MQFGRSSEQLDEKIAQLELCWAHVRRKFYDIHVATDSPPSHGGAPADRRPLWDRVRDPRTATRDPPVVHYDGHGGYLKISELAGAIQYANQIAKLLPRHVFADTKTEARIAA